MVSPLLVVDEDMPYYIRSKNNDRILLILAALFMMSSYFLVSFGSGMYVLFAIVILFLVLSNYKFEVHAFHLFVFQFCLYCYANSMWALNYHNALSNGNTIFEVLACLSVMYCHFKKFNDVTQLMKLIMWVGYVVVFYCYLVYGVDRVADLSSDEGRLSNSFNNINTLSMLASTVVIINIFFIVFRKRRSWLDLLIFPTIFFILSSQSRKGVGMIVLGVFLLFYLKYLRSNEKSLMPLMKFTGFVLLFIIVIILFSSTSAMEGVTNRMMGFIAQFTEDGDVDASTQARIGLRHLGWEQFHKTPWFGIGMGCSYFLTHEEFGTNTYLHDNYVELAACGGIFALVSYYSIFLYLLFKERKYFKVDDMCNLILVLLIIKFFTDYGSVSYITKMNYFYLMVYFLHLESCKVKYPWIK